ncbi:MAG: hypothetical protein DRI65_13000 [Chloroflexota bacterium]|nr:MAG: hypothetical protein DRI65_13000 [Chloroflexota bacterium]
MTTNIFLPSVQYGDLEGSIKADRADMNDAHKWLLTNGHINENEFVLGISMDIRENRGEFNEPVYVNFLLKEPMNFDIVKSEIESKQEPIEVRKVRIEMPLKDFFSLFKRFNLTLSPKGLLNGREYTYYD